MTLGDEPVRAPELRGTAWLNTERPLTLADLRGKLVLLDFWTYCCINCLHVLEDLKYLEHKYADRPFVVVGVHSPKFTNEDNAESVRQATARYGITHPIVLDSGRRTWDAYAVRGWPTLVLVDPNGYILGQVSGEGHRDALDTAIGQALDLLAEAGALDATPLPLRLEAETGALSPFSPLLYPGKALADEASGRLYIADTGHHRLVHAALDGTDYATIGSSEPGAEDGDYDTASFRSPQGMALDSEHGWLYVADTGNHLLRRVDLGARTVTTIAGTGAQGFQRRGSGAARATPLNSPWDVALVNGTLYMAMAGLHQIWVYDPAEETVGVFAGSGAEGRNDGPAEMAALAQPSGLASDGARLFVADSEISSIRAVSLDGPPIVRTLAGGDLFQFGDHDGKGDYARLQHPLGVAWIAEGAPSGGYVAIADTYNHKLKLLHPTTREVTTLAGAGMPGDADGAASDARFSEPGGLSYAAGALYVADTNNSTIRVVSLPSGETRTLAFPGLCAPGLCLPG
ncbi:MAG: NHL repeat containing protein [Ktedonobacterales bacterium]|jgi:thiol-disulfide isomerase/thioredoxin|nr:MAG: NHL repeat containing protein [Ktedonobacterales bacterium]